MRAKRRVKLFRNGRNQAVRIPRAYELPGTEAILRWEDGVLVIEPVPEAETSLSDWLKTITPWDEPFPEPEDPPPEPLEL